MIPNPDIITWRRDGYQVVLNEDGVMIRVTRERTFEQQEVADLISLFNTIVGHLQDGNKFGSPQPPTREEARWLAWEDREREAARRATKAIAAEFDTGPVPF